MDQQKVTPKNFLCLLSDAVGWPLGNSFLSHETIVPLFISRITASNFLLGLISGIYSFGQFAPQLIAANWIEKLPIKKKYVVILGILGERLPLLLLALAVFFMDSPTVLLVLFYLLWTISHTATGLNLPAFLNLFAKTIPAHRRGIISGIGHTGGTLLAVFGAYAARTILQNSEGLIGYAWCFLIGFVFLLLSIIPLGLIDELPDDVHHSGRRLRDYLKELPAIVRGNLPFTWYIVVHILLQVAFALILFLTAYAIKDLQVSEGTIALCTAVIMAFRAGGSIVFGYIGDKRGYRIVLIISAIGAVITYAIMCFSPSIFLVYVGFAFAGLFTGAIMVATNMTMEYSDTKKTATYVAIVFTATVPFKVGIPILAGLMADVAGLQAVFILSLVLSAGALVTAVVKLQDPRFFKSPTKTSR